MSGDARGDVEHRAGAGACLKFERTDRGNAQLNRPSGHRFTRAGGKPAGLRDELNQNDGRDDRVARKMTLKKPVVASGSPTAARPHARHELDELLDETHRRLVWQQVD